MADEVETCDTECSPTGRCDPAHPLHCCHFARTRRRQIGRHVYAFWQCEKCGKRGKTKTLVATLKECAI